MDFITRLVERTLGRATLAQARVASRFAPLPYGAGQLPAADEQAVEAERFWENPEGPLEQETFVERPPSLSQPRSTSRAASLSPPSLVPQPKTAATDDLSAHRPATAPFVRQAESTTPVSPAPSDEPAVYRRRAPVLTSTLGVESVQRQPTQMPTDSFSRSQEPVLPEYRNSPPIRPAAVESEPHQPVLPPIVTAAAPAASPYPRESVLTALREADPVRFQSAATPVAGPPQTRSSALGAPLSSSPSELATPEIERRASGPPPALVPQEPPGVPAAEGVVEAVRYLERQPEADVESLAARPSIILPGRRTPGVATSEAIRPVVAGQPPSSQPPVIRVHIGRVEVQAITPPAPPPRPAPARRAPALSLADYLERRNEGRR